MHLPKSFPDDLREPSGVVSVQSSMVRAAIAVLLLFGTACKREHAPAPSPPPETPTSRLAFPESRSGAQSRAIVRATAWANVSVEKNQGWDAEAVARTGVAEIDAVRTVILERGPRVPRDQIEPIDVRYVPESKSVEALVGLIPRTERVLRWGKLALLRPSSRLLVISRDAEIGARLYMKSLALLMAQPDLGATWHLDAAAIWLSGLALGHLKNEPGWGRGRVWREGFDLAADVMDPASFQEAVGWALSDLPPEGLDLDYGVPDRGRGLMTALRRASRDKAWPHREPIEIHHRAAAWFVLYFLGTFSVGDDRHVRFGGTPKYEPSFQEFIMQPASAYVLLEASPTRKARAEIGPYLSLARRKLNLGQVRAGIIVRWDEFKNAEGLQTGGPDDDLLR
jgi:hypothetical protein